MLAVREYTDLDGDSPFSKWFDGLSAEAAAKISTAIARLQGGNFSNVKPVGRGVAEYRIDFGPGYRIYLGQDGETLVILLGGGVKKRQQQDIADAQERWKDYKRRKTQGSE